MKSKLIAAIPVRNGATTILRTLDSIANQTMQPDRVVVQNNSSTDKTKEIVMAYKRLKIEWVENGADSRYALSPGEVVHRSLVRSPAISEAAAHFELAQYLWRQEGFSERAIAHFNAAHELQPDNITYKRQAYSALSVSRSGGDDSDGWTRFRQAPQEGEDWPFVSDFNKDMVRLQPELAARLKLPGAGAEES